ncbi:MAG: 8-amino-7-oxononanoate synthase [Nitrospinae bacterium]|nr:8-amino-7-oxononanoate synthase [Nitrospinota bacterium]
MSELFESELAGLASRRALRILRSTQGRAAVIDGRELILFSTNDYLGLSHHPAVIESACRAAREYGWGSGASRLISGTTIPHAEFEQAAAAFLDKPAALMFSSGYAANTGLLTALMGRGDTVFADRLCHASILDGARFSGAKLIRYTHNDPDDLARRLAAAPARGKRLIVTDGVFSMDGDIAPLAELAQLAERCRAIFMVDDAHGFGVSGPQGRGTPHMAGVHERVDIHVATLGKALGGEGGFIAGSRSLIDGLINFSRSFIYSTSPPAAQAASGLTALELVKSDTGAKLREKLFENMRKMVQILEKIGYNTQPVESHIVPIVMESGERLTGCYRYLLERGLYVPAIRPPTVPSGGERFRVSLSAAHTGDDMARLGSVFDELKAGGLL